MPASTKIIVSNKSALKRKYGTGLTRITEALKSLIQADKKRGISTNIVFMDMPTHMSPYGTAVIDASNPQQNKNAVDAIFRVAEPHYLMILGAIDVIPHQDLKNSLYSGEDPDKHAWSDLPYACDAPYSRRIENFLAPSRVVGRLPDITGDNSPNYLVKLLRIAARWRSRPPEAYDKYLGITAKVWRSSTSLSLRKLFKSSSEMKISPKQGYRWDDKTLERLSHFINCHGAESDPSYYGEGNGSFPIAHTASWLDGKLTEGVVAAAECCYGAELYDPQGIDGPEGAVDQIGLCNTYLASKAYGFFGSSTIAYGPSHGNGAADLICQYFLKHVFGGASTGRAAFEARLDFIRDTPNPDLVDLKTIAQFALFGDPSIHPVELESSESLAIMTSANQVKARIAAKVSLAGRSHRRRNLKRLGLLIGESAVPITKSVRTKTASSVLKHLEEIAKQTKVSINRHLVFQPSRPRGNWYMREKALSKRAGLARDTRTHIMFSQAIESKKLGMMFDVVVALEEGGRITRYRHLHRR